MIKKKNYLRNLLKLLLIILFVQSCNKSDNGEDVNNAVYSDEQIMTTIKGSRWVSDWKGYFWSFSNSEMGPRERTSYNNQKVMLLNFLGDIAEQQNLNGYFVGGGTIHIMTMTHFSGGIDLGEGVSYNYYQDFCTLTPTSLSDNSITATLKYHNTRISTYENAEEPIIVHLKRN